MPVKSLDTGSAGFASMAACEVVPAAGTNIVPAAGTYSAGCQNIKCRFGWLAHIGAIDKSLLYCVCHPTLTVQHELQR